MAKAGSQNDDLEKGGRFAVENKSGCTTHIGSTNIPRLDYYKIMTREIVRACALPIGEQHV